MEQQVGNNNQNLVERFREESQGGACPEVNPEITLAVKSSQRELEELRNQRLKNDEYQGIISLRKWLSIIVTCGVFIWMIFVGGELSAVTFRVYGAVLSDTVLLALIGGSTANILGMLTIILVFLFPPSKNARVALSKIKLNENRGMPDA